MNESILNSYVISLAMAVGSCCGNFMCAAFGWFDFTWNMAIAQSIIVTIIFLLFTTIGKLFIYFK